MSESPRGPMRCYCTYFDGNYVPRGLVLLASMIEHCRPFRLYVLCLDETTYELLSRHLNPQPGGEVVLVRLAELETADPQLAAVKPARQRVEYYFTITPCWPRYLMRRFAEIDFLTYIDSDMCFFSSPEPVFAELGAASVAITPHRFSPERAALARFGKYNVGWLGFRRDESGLACLEWYRERCLEWCYDRLEGERFADQKYLEQFPVLFANVAEVSHKGVNTALFNANNYRFTEADGRILVDEAPLVCYHFQGVREAASGSFKFKLDGEAAQREGVLVRVVYMGYLNRLKRMLELLRPIFPGAQLSRTERDPEPPPWEYRPLGWSEDDPALTGWDVGSVAASRRTGWPPFLARLASTAPYGEGHDHNNAMSFAYVLGLAARGKDRVSLLDWGGALGAHYRMARAFYPDLAIDCVCREVPTTAVAGRELNPAVTFVESDEAALGRRYDLVLASSVIQYEKDWRPLVARLAKATAGYLFMTRTPVVTRVPSFVVVQRVPGFGAAYQGWFLNVEELLAACRAAGLELLREFAVLEGFPVPGAPEAGQGRGFLFRPMA